MILKNYTKYLLCAKYCARGFKYRFQQKEGLLECGWQGNHMGVIIYSFNLNISPKMSYSVLEYDVVMLQNYMLKIL